MRIYKRSRITKPTQREVKMAVDAYVTAFKKRNDAITAMQEAENMLRRAARWNGDITEVLGDVMLRTGFMVIPNREIEIIKITGIKP